MNSPVSSRTQLDWQQIFESENQLTSTTIKPQQEQETTTTISQSAEKAAIQASNVKWKRSQIAKILWQNVDEATLFSISDATVLKVNKAADYLGKEGWELKGCASDGDCFFHAFLGSYATLSIKTPLLDEQSNQMAYLRGIIAEIVERKGNQERAAEIKRRGEWIRGEEGSLLAAALDIPVRLITVNENEGSYTDDRLYFKKQNGDLDNQDWKDASPTTNGYILIIDLGGHFIYAQKALAQSRTSSQEVPQLGRKNKAEKKDIYLAANKISSIDEEPLKSTFSKPGYLSALEVKEASDYQNLPRDFNFNSLTIKDDLPMDAPFSIHSSAPSFYSVPSTSVLPPLSPASVHLQAAREAYEKVQQANPSQARGRETNVNFLPPTTTDAPPANERDQERAAQARALHQQKLAKKFQEWMSAHRLASTQVSGQGLNCLLNALLQHATGRYQQKQFKKAQHIKKKLTQEFPLYPLVLNEDDARKERAIVLVNQACNTNLRAYFIQANEEGLPCIISVIGDEQGDPVAIWNQTMHYVALITMEYYSSLAPQGQYDQTPSPPQECAKKTDHPLYLSSPSIAEFFPSGTLTRAISPTSLPLNILSLEEEAQLAQAKEKLTTILNQLKYAKAEYRKILEALSNQEQFKTTLTIKENGRISHRLVTPSDVRLLCSELAKEALDYIHFLSGKAAKLLAARDYARAKIEFQFALDYATEALGGNHLETLKIQLDNGLCLVYSAGLGASDPSLLEATLRQLEPHLLEPSCSFDTKRAIAIAEYGLAQYYHQRQEIETAAQHLERSRDLRQAYGATEKEFDKVRYLEGVIAYARGEEDKALKLLKKCYDYRKVASEHKGDLIPVLQHLVNWVGDGSQKMLWLEELLHLQQTFRVDRREIIHTQLQMLENMQMRVSTKEYEDVMHEIEGSLAELPITKESPDVALSYMKLAEVRLTSLLPRQWPNVDKRKYHRDTLNLIQKAESHLRNAIDQKQVIQLGKTLQHLKDNCIRLINYFSDPMAGRLIVEPLHPEDEGELKLLEEDCTINHEAPENLTEEELEVLSEFSTEVSYSGVAADDVFLTIAEFKSLPDKGEINPYKLRLAQGGFSLKFTDGQSLDDTKQKLINYPGYTKKIPPIQIGIHQGKVFSFDTRRLIVHQQAKEENSKVYIRYQKIAGDDLQKRIEEIFSPRSWNGTVTALRYGGKGSPSQPYINPALRPQLGEIVQEEFKPFPSDRQGADDNGFPIQQSQAKKIRNFLEQKKEEGSKRAINALKRYERIFDKQGKVAADNFLIQLKKDPSLLSKLQKKSEAEEVHKKLMQAMENGSQEAIVALKKLTLIFKNEGKQAAYNFLINLKTQFPHLFDHQNES